MASLMPVSGQGEPPIKDGEEFTCPVACATAAALEASHQLGRSLRALRKARQACRTCDRLVNCPVWQEFRGQVELAVAEVAQEWKLRL